ncbi:MAG TPA: TRAP transporter small permease subunit [Xanthobacteraceae bacterium]
MPPAHRLSAQAAAGLADRIDRLNAAVGRAVMWCCLAMVLVQVVVVLMRYVLGLGSIWLSESIVYAHATLFMGAAAWTLQRGGHVRVDIFYSAASSRTRAVVDLVGAIVLLLPFCAVLAWFSLPYVGRSWAILERSREASGLPFVFLLKSLIPAFALLLGLQGAAQVIRAGLVLAGGAPVEPAR